MADEGHPGIFAAIWRSISFWKKRQALAINRSADEQFTGTARGIADAFDLQQDKMVSQFKELRAAVSEVEAVLEDKRQRLDELDKEEEGLLVQREGALAAAEKAEAAGDQDEFEKHSNAYERFDTRIQQIEETQARLTAEVAEAEASMKRHMFRLTEFQAEIQQLPQQKAEAISDFVSASKIVELNDRLNNLQTSLDKGPIDAVLQSVKKRTAEARISEKLAGTDVRLQDAEYAREGRASTSKSKLKEALAARKIEREGTPSPETQTEQRQQI